MTQVTSLIRTEARRELREHVAASGDGWLLPVPHLPTGHWPMFSRPAELAGLLATLAGPDHAQ